MRSLSVLAFAIAALVIGAQGCSSPDGGDEGESGTNAYTVDSGDRFVVSAAPEKVVLRKKVGSAPFPFDAAGLHGKALLVHPIEKKAANGVYARALAVDDAGDQLVVTTKPLTLEEMATIAEADVVRIYVDAGKLLKPTIRPKALGGGATFSGLDFGAAVKFDHPTGVSPGITFAHKVESASLDPDARVAWSSDTGLEVGARLAFDWSSKLTVSGKVSGNFFRSPDVQTPDYIVTVPIGYFPVPVTIYGTASMGCSATFAGPIETTVVMKANASIGGSVTINPRRGVAPSEWFGTGAWAPEAKGALDVHLEGTKAKLDAAIECEMPRIEIHALVAGVMGPKVSVIPTISVEKDALKSRVDLMAGVEGGLFGEAPSVSFKVYSYQP